MEEACARCQNLACSGEGTAYCTECLLASQEASNEKQTPAGFF